MKLLGSRKFLTLLLDTVVSLLVYFITRYVAPDYAQDVLFVIALLQPVVLAVIVGWSYEDGKAKAAKDFRHYT